MFHQQAVFGNNPTHQSNSFTMSPNTRGQEHLVLPQTADLPDCAVGLQLKRLLVEMHIGIKFALQAENWWLIHGMYKY